MKDVDLALRWVSNGNDADAFALPYPVYSTAPSWVLHDTPAASTTASGFFSIKAVNSSVIWAAGGDGSATAPVVVRSIDGGSTWTDVTGNLSKVDLYCVTAVDSLHAWAGTGDGRIFATTDGGGTWANQSYPFTQSPFIDGIWFFDTQKGLALGDPASGTGKFVILKTSDGGQNWSHVLVEPTGGSSEAGWNNSWWWNDQQHGWFGTNASKVWKSTDGGAHWSSAASTSMNSIGVAFGDNANGVAAHDNGVTSVSTDGGASWSSGSTLGGTISGIAFAPGNSNVWAVGPSTPYRSTDGGQSWTAETTFPFDGSITHVSVADPTHAFASTSFGQILSYIPTVTGVPIGPGSAVPAGYALLPNYPNPFNPATVFTYRVGESGRVRLGIYDLLGREVAVLFDGTREAGTFTVRWDAKEFASGVYFARLTAWGSNPANQAFTQVQKLILLR